MKYLLLVVYLLALKSFAAPPKSFCLRVCDFKNIRQVNTLYPTYDKETHIMMESQEELEDLMVKLTSFLKRDVSPYSTLEAIEPFLQEDEKGRTYARYSFGQRESFKIFTFKSNNIYGYWDANKDLNADMKESFRVKTFKFHLFPSFTEWMFDYLRSTRLIKFFRGTSNQPDFSLQREEDGIIIRVTNNFREEQAQNVTHLNFPNALSFLCAVKGTGETVYFVKPASYETTVVKFQRGKCQSPSPLESVAVVHNL